MRRRLLEIEQRLVDPGGKLGVGLEQSTDGVDIPAFDGRYELLGRRFGERVDLVLELGPAREPVAAGDDELRVAQGEAVGSRGLGCSAETRATASRSPRQ